MSKITNLIAAIALLITAVTGAANLYIGVQNSQKIEQVHDLTNSKMTELQEEIRAGANLKGRAEQRAIDKKED